MGEALGCSVPARLQLARVIAEIGGLFVFAEIAGLTHAHSRVERLDFVRAECAVEEAQMIDVSDVWPEDRARLPKSGWRSAIGNRASSSSVANVVWIAAYAVDVETKVIFFDDDECEMGPDTGRRCDIVRSRLPVVRRSDTTIPPLCVEDSAVCDRKADTGIEGAVVRVRLEENTAHAKLTVVLDHHRNRDGKLRL